jgi:hypothetical protein
MFWSDRVLVCFCVASL